MNGLWNKASTTLVPSRMRLVRAAAKLSISSGSQTLPLKSGSCIGPTPGIIGSAGRRSRSKVQTEARPMRSAPSATHVINAGRALEPALGRTGS